MGIMALLVSVPVTHAEMTPTQPSAASIEQQPSQRLTLKERMAHHWAAKRVKKIQKKLVKGNYDSSELLRLILVLILAILLLSLLSTVLSSSLFEILTVVIAVVVILYLLRYFGIL